MKVLLFGCMLCAALGAQARASAFSDFNAGVAAHNDHNEAEAIRYLGLALAAPDLGAHLRPAAFFDRAQAYAFSKQYDAAIADYTRLLALTPGDYDALSARANTYLVQKKYDAARADFAAAIGRRPELIDAYYGHARANIAERKYDDAIKDYDKALTALPGDTDLLMLRGDAAREGGRYDAAIKDFDTVIARNSRYGDAYEMRGRTYLESGNAKAAVSDYEDAIDIAPNDAGLREIAGIAEWEYGNYRDAARNFTRSAADPSRATFSYLWLFLAERDGIDRDLAEQAGKADLKKWPGPVLGLFLGTAAVGDAAAAAQDADPDVQKDRSCAASFFIGEWHLFRKEPAEARAPLGEAAKCRTTLPEANAARAELARLGP